MRGDEGPLPKLTIELLDAGYRAVDPELKVRYIVTEAPADMAVTSGAQVRHSTQPPPGDDRGASVVPPAAKPVALVAAGAEPTVTPSIPAKVSPSVPVAATHVSETPAGALAAQVIRQRDESPTAESPIHYRELALAVRTGATKDSIEALMRARLEQARASLNVGDAQQYVQIAVFDHMFVKRPVRPPVATLAWKNWRGDAVLAFPGFAAKAPEPSATTGAGAPSTRAPSWTSTTDAPSEAPKPTSLAPAPVVAVGSATPPSAAAPAAVSATPGATVPRPAAATPSVAPEPSRSSVIPAPVVSVGVRAPSASQPPPAPMAPPRPAEAEIPVPLVAKRSDAHADDVEISVEVPPPSSPVIDVEVAPASSPLTDLEVAPASGPLIDVAVASIPVSELPVSSIPAAPSVPAPVAAVKPSSAPPSSKPTPVPPSGAPRRRAKGEDLIGDLFERMHELAFMADMVSGAEFVLRVLRELIPCEGIVIHVFDLGKREFVVVRAHGPNARAALLHRTPGDEPLVRSIMARRGATILDGAPNRPPASSSLTKLGIEPRAVLCGAARLGGRYLGLIELANPQGGQPFHDGEANALDYVCEQFAEFVASRPVVLDADVVVGP